MDRYDAVIVGTGHGGVQAAIALRQHGFEGSIALLGKDNVPPYERPPLSKEYLAREKSFERIMIRPETFWAEKQIDLLLDSEVTEIDPKGRRVTLKNGRTMGYSDLVWSGGGNPRQLSCPGARLRGVHSIRNKADIDRIMAELDAGARRVVVIGGGYIGLEAAAVLIKLGCDVAVLESLERVLARVAGEELSRFFEAEHRGHGVDLRLRAAIECLEGDALGVTGVKLVGGEVLPCDMVIVGIGVDPAIGPLARAGAAASNGVEVDGYCRTSLAHIHAIGDCALRANSDSRGTRLRLESVQNAVEMANTAARDICGKALPYAATPWFWSDQYDLKLQTVGLSQGHEATVVRKDPTARSFSVIYLKDGKVVALDCVNAMKDFVQGRKLVETGAKLEVTAALGDPRTPIKDLSPSQA